MNNRRKLVIALGASALAAPFGAFAQQQGIAWRVGFLAGRGRPAAHDPNPFQEFSNGMREFGYVEGKNLAIEWRYTDGNLERLPRLAAELVQLKVDVIVAIGPQATDAAQKATSTIPIVMVVSLDPVASGLVASLARPGGNITGLSNYSVDLGPKHLEMLQSMAPKLSRVAILVNPSNSSHAALIKSVETAAQKLGVKILPLEARAPRDFENAFSRMAKEKPGAVIVMLDPVFIRNRREIAELAAKHRMPSISAFREYVEDGGLMSYGQSLTDQYRYMATFVDKILKGAKAGNLPVEQPTKYEMYINRKTAKTLGLTIPRSLLISADKIIE